MRWPWQQKTEVRQSQPFTDLLVSALVSSASGDSASPAASAAWKRLPAISRGVSPSLPWKGHRTWYGTR